MAQAIRGVNLGGWLVLEPWITHGLFKGTEAPDEFTFCATATSKQLRHLGRHRKTFITRQDFKWLADHGIQAVRIPVGYWIFGDEQSQPFVGAIEYLDRAFEWAEDLGLKVLISLHGAPGSQNGEAHSGQQGGVGWHDQPANIEYTLAVIERLAEQYAGNPALLGLEALNEPSSRIPRRILRDYYKQAYRSIRRLCGREAWVVFSDGFQPRRWAWSLHWPLYRLAYLDSHQYQVYTPADKALDPDGHVRKAKGEVAGRLRRMAWHRKLIVGEWSAALDAQSLKGLDARQRDEAYRRYIRAQLEAYGRADAWFYWTYKTETGGPWSFRELVERGVWPLAKHS